MVIPWVELKNKRTLLMHFVFYGKDKKGALQVRVDNRPAHVEWLKSNPIVLAGPMLDENGDMSGSMVVLSLIHI